MPENENAEVEETEETEETEEEQIQDPAAVLEQNRKTNRENKSLRDRLKKTEGELEKLRQASLSEQEKAIEDAKNEARAEVEREYQAKLLERSVRARAAGVLADPDDAWRLIDFEEIDPEDDKAIDKEIEELIKAKPYLAARQRQRDSIDQGPQGKGPSSGGSADTWLRSVTGTRR